MVARSKEIWLIGFFLSKYGSTIEGKETTPPTELNTIKWENAYRVFYEKFGLGRTIKSFQNSLKNCRDTFDGHIENSSRKGWQDLYRKPVKLPPIAKSVFNKYNSVNRESIWEEIKVMLSSYENRQKVNTNTRKTEIVRDLFNNKSMKNPDWTREELILALDLYFNLDQGQMHKGHPEVIRVSNELIRLDIHKVIPDKVKFRNPSGVSRRLGNFKTMDSGYKGEGLTNSGKLAKLIWKEFNNHRDKLRKEADLIRQLYLKPDSENNSAAEPKVNYKSGFFFQFHKNRETDPLVIKVKKEMVLTNSKSLKCEVCGFDSVYFYGELGNDLMEIHYNKELIDEPGLESSSMEDFIIVCSNCHKVLDKNFRLLNADNLKKIVRKR